MKKLLLDENLPEPLKNHFSNDFEVTSVHEAGWQSLKNGELLKAMTVDGIEILLTVDKNLQFQQNLDKFNVQLVVLLTFDNRLKTLVSKLTQIETEINSANPLDKVIIIDLRN